MAVDTLGLLPKVKAMEEKHLQRRYESAGLPNLKLYLTCHSTLPEEDSNAFI